MQRKRVQLGSSIYGADEILIWSNSIIFSILTGGMMPFAVVFVELFFIFKGIWSNQYTYFIVGFLAIVFVILVATAAEISIVVVYLQLQAEVNENWQSGLTRCSIMLISRFPVGLSVVLASVLRISCIRNLYLHVGIPLLFNCYHFDHEVKKKKEKKSHFFVIFSYSVFYYFSRLEVSGFVPALVYFVYSLLMCGIYSLCVGSIGFFATFFFLRKIYSAIKVSHLGAGPPPFHLRSLK